MVFSPRNYASLASLNEATIGGAHSDTSINNMDVFGWFEGNPYECKYVYDAEMDMDVAYAGDCILH